MSTSDRDAARAFLARHLPMEGVTDADDLFERGLMTSLFAVQLVRFVEKRTEREVPDALLARESFASVDAIARTFERMRALP